MWKKPHVIKRFCSWCDDLVSSQSPETLMLLETFDHIFSHSIDWCWWISRACAPPAPSLHYQSNTSRRSSLRWPVLSVAKHGLYLCEITSCCERPWGKEVQGRRLLLLAAEFEIKLPLICIQEHSPHRLQPFTATKYCLVFSTDGSNHHSACTQGCRGVEVCRSCWCEAKVRARTSA